MERRLKLFLFFFVLLVVYAMFSRPSPYRAIDDAFISYRYARNFAAGDGLSFNPGHLVEGYSSTVFVLLLAAFTAVFGRTPIGGVVFGVIFQAATAATAAAFLLRFVKPRIFTPMPMFVVAFLICHPTGVGYAQSGMETSLASFLVVLTAYLAASAVGDEPAENAAPEPTARQTVRRAVSCGVAMLLLALTRPEMLVMFAPVAAWLWLARRTDRVRRVLAFAAPFVVGYGAFLLWRHSYFGEWQPNTYYAKVAGGGLFLALRGWSYFIIYVKVAVFPLFLGIALLLQAGTRAPFSHVERGLLAMALAGIAAVIYVGGDHFPLARFLVPISSLLLLAFTLSLGSFRDRLPARAGDWFRRNSWLSWIAASLLFMASMTLSMIERGQGMHFARMGRLAQSWCDLGREMAAAFGTGTSVGAVPIGALGYCSDMDILDLVGLTDRTIAHTKTDLTLTAVGHGRYNADYVLEVRKPHILLLQCTRFRFPLPEWALLRTLLQKSEQQLINHPAFRRDYCFHRLKTPHGYLNYWSRRDFEPPESNSGAYPVPGVACPIPAQEPPPDVNFRSIAELKEYLTVNGLESLIQDIPKWYQW